MVANRPRNHTSIGSQYGIRSHKLIDDASEEASLLCEK
jgi:hypothetical protein